MELKVIEINENKNIMDEICCCIAEFMIDGFEAESIFFHPYAITKIKEYGVDERLKNILTFKQDNSIPQSQLIIVAHKTSFIRKLIKLFCKNQQNNL